MPLSANKDFTPHVRRLSQKLRAAQVSTRVDDSSATIGKRYSRNDELGTLLGITIDFQTLKDGTLTISTGAGKSVKLSTAELTTLCKHTLEASPLAVFERRTAV